MHLEEYTLPISEDSSSDLFRLRLDFKTVVRLSSLVQKRTASRAEAAGLLFGVAEHNFIHVIAYRSFALELPYEATLPLQQFQEAAKTALAAARFDPEVSALQPIGWYRLHLEQCSDMSDQEVLLHNDIAPQGPFAALLLQSSAAGLLSGLVFTSSAEDRTLTFANRRRGLLSVSTASSGVESVEVTVRDTAKPVPAAIAESWRTRILQNLALHRGGFKSSLNRYAWAFAVVTACIGFLVGATVSQDGQASTGSSSVSTPKPGVASASAVSKGLAFDLAMKREGPNIVITWNNGLTKPTLAYLTVAEHSGTTNLNLIPNYRPDGLLLLPVQGGTVEASLALSDGLDTIERRARLGTESKAADRTDIGEAGGSKERLASLRAAERTSDEVSRLETRNRRLEALITVLEQRKEEKTRRLEDPPNKSQP